MNSSSPTYTSLGRVESMEMLSIFYCLNPSYLDYSAFFVHLFIKVVTRNGIFTEAIALRV